MSLVNDESAVKSSKYVVVMDFIDKFYRRYWFYEIRDREFKLVTSGGSFFTAQDALTEGNEMRAAICELK